MNILVNSIGGSFDFVRKIHEYLDTSSTTRRYELNPSKDFTTLSSVDLGRGRSAAEARMKPKSM
jgi:hypothetical protein